jgi:hypothetical protein
MAYVTISREEGWNMTRKLLGAPVASLLFLGIASASHAALFDITYTGTIASGNSAVAGGVVQGYDTFGFFGSANSHLNGDAFSLVYTFDTSKGAFDITPWATQLYGGRGETGNYPPPGVAVLTINGNSVSFGGNVVAQTQFAHCTQQYCGAPTGYFVSSIYTTTSNLDPNSSLSDAETAMFWQRVSNDPLEKMIPLLVGTPFNISAGPNDYFSGSFLLRSGNQILASGLLDATTLTVSAVPLPPTGVLFITGLGVIALLGWFRKRESGVGLKANA